MMIMATGLMSYAQFTLTPKNADVTGTNTELKVINSVMMNNTTNPNDTVFIWKTLQYTGPAGWLVSFCDPLNCYTVYKVGDSADFPLGKGKGWSHKIDIAFEGTSGSGTYKFLVYSKLNPSINDTITIRASAFPVSVKEVNKVKTVSFAPNPVSEALTFKFPVKESITVDIYNILGSKVKSFTHTTAETEVNIGSLQNGVYFIRFEDGGKLYTKQFTKAD